MCDEEYKPMGNRGTYGTKWTDMEDNHCLPNPTLNGKIEMLNKDDGDDDDEGSSKRKNLPFSIDCHEMFPRHKQPPVVSISSRSDVMVNAGNADCCIVDWTTTDIHYKA